MDRQGHEIVRYSGCVMVLPLIFGDGTPILLALAKQAEAQLAVLGGTAGDHRPVVFDKVGGLLKEPLEEGLFMRAGRLVEQEVAGLNVVVARRPPHFGSRLGNKRMIDVGACREQHEE